MSVKVRYVQPDGREVDVDAVAGYSAMEAAVRNAVAGIVGECGGAASCGTCHVHVDEAWIEKTGPATVPELEMLEMSEYLRSSSRLACQLTLEPALDGIKLHIPPEQD